MSNFKHARGSRVFFLNTSINFRFERFLYGVALLSLISLLLLFAIASKVPSQFCQLEGLGSLFLVKSIVELYAISR